MPGSGPPVVPVLGLSPVLPGSPVVTALVASPVEDPDVGASPLLLVVLASVDVLAPALVSAPVTESPEGSPQAVRLTISAGMRKGRRSDIRGFSPPARTLATPIVHTQGRPGSSPRAEVFCPAPRHSARVNESWAASKRSPRSPPST